ncbi:uncharacterized protein LOC119684543 [Teleopsis dalmanni]|uniref:uncharacterized protein LOC119684543 n=1 Tax=Teleopsis dalmanni TaxID=139649 RepID=UPI000D32D13B|nr:uncharacterized protein LOC119684543 [Teleopsis dalmanni]
MFTQLWICHHQRFQFLFPLLQLFLKLFILLAICGNLPQNVSGQIAYKGHLSDLRIKELDAMAKNLNESINLSKYPCESYFDYVCSRNRPLYSILGRTPDIEDLMKLFQELQEDSVPFAAKQKLIDFFISCNMRKGLEECYRQSFEYFIPIFGYIISKNHLDGSAHEHSNFLEILQRFYRRAQRTENFAQNPILLKLGVLTQSFTTANTYFRIEDLNHEYRDLRIYRDGFEYNVKNLEQHLKRNSTYEFGMQRTMLDWSLYVYQSRNKPMSYYFPTFNVHLWMTLYNNTERFRELKTLNKIAECLKLPQFVNVLEEARILAIVYLKSIRNAWQEYSDWISSSPVHQEVFDQENVILKPYNLTNKHIFFTLYAQNFCEFGKELAESVFYLGIKQNQDFGETYSCGYQTERTEHCVY